ncbi:DUF3489 domain-containing protein [Mesorhizobium sp. RP14(2022)]|uniref:DUF3489 domain-containing protein n=1 Tax=Mesorhizobium liriopis TaxID=2953882 RepID=A0ABT1C939_9HYPH|nr:DUF3489 domain-containing protein [Mesorhizobium liriopis]MCO6050481.1 DUF3489 domain-containing protein [Mesorhizobium liriopis]
MTTQMEPASAAKPRKAGAAKAVPAPTKADLVLKQLRSARGATLAQLQDLTGWQAHSVRGFLSGTVRKKLGLTLTSETAKDGTRRYHVAIDPSQKEVTIRTEPTADRMQVDAEATAASVANGADSGEEA